ncbi:MAG: hypothetical protein AAF480_18180 [Actinomycetota bacterium]
MSDVWARATSWLEGDGEWRRLEIASLALIAFVGLLSIADPLWANQATFALFSSEIADGEVLYRDVVDLKQPGIFIWFLGAQLPFGRNSVGIHLVELITWLAFAWVLQRQARAWFQRRWLAATLPVPIVGTYYIAATYNDATQVEALINIPLLAAVMLVMPDDEGRLSKRRAFVAGFAIALVAYIKLPYAAIPLAVAVPTLWRWFRRNARETLVEVVWPAILGSAVILVPFFVYFGINGVYGEIYELYFEYSRERNEIWPRPTSRLGVTLRRGLRIFSPLIALAALGFAVDWRRMINRRTLAMAAWAAVALPLYLVQQWWPYHLFLWTVPFAVMAWYALDVIVTSGRSWREPLLAAGAGVVVLLALSQLGPDGIEKVERMATNDLALTQDGRDSLRQEIDPDYGAAQAWAAWNTTMGASDSAWGIGVKPSFLFVAGQEHQLRHLSWPVQLITEEIYGEMADDLLEQPPERFIVHDDAFDDMDLRAPGTLAVIESSFCLAAEDGPYNYLLQVDDPGCP